ncbi:polyribonucleotide nucleotidyltransferase [Campylobacter hyointestinalis]|uniref:Polyribonucleotide nucleotidyltransferase n=1 Tax=Campylobacter hyointestinalis subsp. lawsonii TaxID=91353 RepID=A0AAV6EFV3_CAMHY|nr:polyribonucleotide nucleotidyltransferase [Campylobacter hyointestinalis]KAB0613280.1 polyribonucleotide nucleotidyltransferase [Campylobacter hyointestinalis subsp. lawsonii]QKF69129.1 polynucleotide phosphorylase [Campylobacter hyointestinalis subsp. lawsonii]RAZ28365.1 polyribonucleotide nucleotidyltransferase [Campylobacter hyointestinalis subsp. lawsonii]RAZ50792.1 polyribonucleotide nucleotidyltransferase [Campylobacter hyointestinalis subsp. lawsonii]
MQYSIEVNNQVEIFDLDKVAKQAAGAVLLRVKNTVILATVAREDAVVEDDFLPLTVQYIEKQYAAGRIPGGYIKRETKPGEFETLTSRIIDRSLRPLFPKGYAYPTQIVVMVLSSDPEVDLQVAALNAASVALYLSDIPVERAVCGVRVGYIDKEFVINPTNSELKNSSLDLYVAGVGDELLMIEMRSLPQIQNEIVPVIAIDPMIDPSLNEGFIPKQDMNEFSEDMMVEAIKFAGEAILRGSSAYEEAFSHHKKDNANLEYKPEIENENIAIYIDEFYKNDVKLAINQMAKSERASELSKIAKQIANSDIAIKEGWSEEVILNILGKYKKKIVRSQIIEEARRADGRGLKEVRPITIETNILPSAHGSCLFTRGQTQALVVATLGTDNDAQMNELLTEKNAVSEKFMFNYNFPGFSVGEASPLKAPGRRELGHGNLAKRALYPSVDINSPYSLRIVSEILESNGSSSMASVCGGSLAMRAAGVETIKLVAGVAMGLIFEGDKHAVLTDIMGLEDHDGDMDFKVAGSIDGITALQMDIKLGGISLEVLKEALYQAKEGREHILKIMQRANDDIVINEDVLPKLELFSVDPSKIVDIIGQAGKTIKEIIEKFEVSIDLDREKGEVKIAGGQKGKVEAAKDYIIKILQKEPRSGDFKGRKENKNVSAFSVGDEFEGEVKKVAQFGAFISLRDGVDGLLHISKMSAPLHEGDRVKVKVGEIKSGKISLELN